MLFFKKLINKKNSSNSERLLNDNNNINSIPSHQLKDDIPEQSSEENVDVSIIVPCKNEVNHLKATVKSLMNSKNTLQFEIIVVDDASTDLSVEFLSEPKYKDIKLIQTEGLGAAGARNRGAQNAKGKYLFFCDAHISAPNYWLDRLVATLKEHNAAAVAPAIGNLENNQIVGYGQTWNHTLDAIWLRERPESITEIPIACGCAFGITKAAFDAVGGFDHFFEVWGKEDEELSLKLWLFGHKVVVNPEVVVKHFFRKRHPYHVTTGNVIYNFICLAYSHLSYKNLAKAINAIKDNPSFSGAMAKIMLNEEIIKQRQKYFENRVNDDNFFFEKFKIPFN